jgi:hypothetical protein
VSVPHCELPVLLSSDIGKHCFETATPLNHSLYDTLLPEHIHFNMGLFHLFPANTAKTKDEKYHAPASTNNPGLQTVPNH